jgi:hypothetical protein
VSKFGSFRKKSINKILFDLEYRFQGAGEIPAKCQNLQVHQETGLHVSQISGVIRLSGRTQSRDMKEAPDDR